MITRVKLRNWKSHESTEIRFSEGVNVIVGRMGAGKSSIFDAISFALFGTFPALNSRKVNIDSIIQNRGKVKNEAEVEVELRVGNDTYTIRRVIKKGRGVETSELRKNGKMVAYPQTRKVTAEIEKILGLDYDLFSRAIYGEQNNLDMFLTMTRSERKKKMDELMGMDKFDRAVETARKISNAFRKEAEILKVQINEMSGIVDESEIGRMKKALEDAESRISELKKAKDELAREIKTKAAALEKAESEKGRMLRLQESEKATLSIIESIDAEIRSMGKIDRESPSLLGIKERQLDEKRMELRNLMARKTAIVSEIRRREALLEEREKAIQRAEEIRKQIAALREREFPDYDIESLERQRDNLIGRKQSLLERISESEKSLEELMRAGAECPVCRRPLTDEHRKSLIEEIMSEIDGMKREVEKITESARKCQAEIFRARKAKDEKIRVDAEIRKLEEMLSSLRLPEALPVSNARAELESTEERISEVERQMSEMESEIKSLREMAENLRKMESLERRKAMLEQELGRIRAEMAGIDMNLVNAMDTLRESLTEKKSVLASIESEIRSSNEKISLLRESIKKAEEMLAVLKKRKYRLGFLEYASSRLSEYAESLRKIQSELREKYIENVNAFMDEMWKEIYPYDDFSSLRLNTDNDDYELELFDGDKWVKVDGIASGGERTLAVLTMRLSMSLLLTRDLRFILLDEPTHNMDDSAISLFSEILRTRVGDYASQVIIITHEEKMESAVTGSFYVLEKSGLVTRIARKQIMEEL